MSILLASRRKISPEIREAHNDARERLISLLVAEEQAHAEEVVRDRVWQTCNAERIEHYRIRELLGPKEATNRTASDREVAECATISNTDALVEAIARLVRECTPQRRARAKALIDAWGEFHDTSVMLSMSTSGFDQQALSILNKQDQE